MKSNYPVIICGAGPTGLMLASQLLRFNIDFIIIDKKSAPTKESRAVVVQARSMEIYEQLNLSDEILSNAIKTDGICFWRNGKEISKAELRNFGSDITPFDFLLVYEQSKNELLLYQYLQKHNHEVEWNTELIMYKEEKDTYSITLQRGGERFEVNGKYLVACDGANSKIRESSAMQFTGGTYEHVFYVADTHVKAPICDEKLNFFVAKNTFNLFFPMIGEKRYRAIGILPKQFYHQNAITFSEVSAQVDKDAGLPLGFYNTQWYSTYRLHHKKVQAFNKGNIFFCGDAAHVHSPAGGQGMNTGLQDAYNLAWKLGLVIQKSAKESLLTTYHEERNPVAEDLLNSTDRLFSVMAKNSTVNIFLRMFLLPALMPVLMKIKYIRRKFFLLVSQTEINYVHSSLSKGKAGKIKAGMRLPYVKLSLNDKVISIYQLVRNNSSFPFLLLSYNVPTENVKAGNLLKIIFLEMNNYNEKSFQSAGFPSSFIAIVRPDNYIGYISSEIYIDELDQYMNSFF